VARATQQDEAQVSRYVTGFIKRNLLTKTANANDRRSIDLLLTDVARQLNAEVMDFAWKLNQDMFTELTRAEQQVLVQLLDKPFTAITRE
jgi:DNA-binding MarR family transcriptional regulator